MSEFAIYVQMILWLSAEMFASREAFPIDWTLVSKQLREPAVLEKFKEPWLRKCPIDWCSAKVQDLRPLGHFAIHISLRAVSANLALVPSPYEFMSVEDFEDIAFPDFTTLRSVGAPMQLTSYDVRKLD
jgi:hypothetical protein